MKILTKLMLASAMMVTSGFALPTDPTGDISGGVEVAGIYNQYEDANVQGLIEVLAGGVFNNNAKETFLPDGGIKTAEAVEGTVEEYQAINEAQNLGVCPVGWYPKGSVVGNPEYCSWYECSDPMLWNGLWELINYGEIRNAVHMQDLSSLPDEMEFLVTEMGHTTDTIIWTNEGTQSEEKFIEEVKDIVGDLSKPAGVFNNADGHLELTNATGKDFSGQIDGGNVTLRHDTTATLTSMKVVDITANYTYESAEKFEAPEVNADKYITVAHTAGKTKDAAEAECLSKFASNSNITTFNGTAENTEGYDKRLTFPDILKEESGLNLPENKLATDHIPTAIKGYSDTNALNVSKTINIQFEGGNELTFTGYDDNKVIEFAGDNSAYTGVASFASTIEKVVASGANTLPQKLGEEMGNIELVVNGTNTINNEGAEIAIKSLKVNESGKLIVAAGTTLTVGGTSA